jgi:hypothetical protein
MIAEINAAFSPDLIVMDGVSIFVDGGPDKGTRKEANVIIEIYHLKIWVELGCNFLCIAESTSCHNRNFLKPLWKLSCPVAMLPNQSTFIKTKLLADE